MFQRDFSIFKNWKLLVILPLGLVLFSGPSLIVQIWPSLRPGVLVVLSALEGILIGEMVDFPGYPAWFYTNLFVRGVQSIAIVSKGMFIAASLFPALQLCACFELRISSFVSIAIGALVAGVFLLFDIAQRALTERTLIRQILCFYMIRVLKIKRCELEERLG